MTYVVKYSNRLGEAYSIVFLRDEPLGGWGS